MLQIPSVARAAVLFAVFLALGTTTTLASSDAVIATRLWWITPAQAPILARELVAVAEVSERPVVVRAVVKAIATRYPALVPDTVFSIAKDFPAVAAAAAGEATRNEPSNAFYFAMATVRVAPRYAAEISAATSAEAPDQFCEIAMAVARLHPEVSQSIIFALTEAMPDIQPFLERAKTLVAAGRPVRPSVTVVLAATRDLVEMNRAVTAAAKPQNPPAK